MAGKVKLVDDLISDVRSLLDEENQAAVDDVRDILPALNRAQDFASNILARHYDDPMLVYKNVTLSSGQQEYDIPDDAFEQRLEKVELKNGQTFYPLERISYRNITLFETTSKINIPYFYCVIGNKYRLIPGPTNINSLRIWYLFDPLALVQQQGRITLVNATDNYVLVDEIGEDLTTESDQLDSYVNIIDGQSGVRKASFQIKSMTDNKITFKTTPSRISVLNIDINDDLATIVDNEGLPVTVNQDDYVCIIKGSCIPFFKKPFSNYLIAYAVAELSVIKLGGDATMIQQVKDDLEKQVEHSWVGRESTMVVKKKNPQWQYTLHRYKNT